MSNECSLTIDDYFAVQFPFGDGKDNNGQQDSQGKQKKGKFAESDSERRADEAKSMLDAQPDLLEEADEGIASVADLLVLKHLCDTADFRLHTGGNYESNTTAFGDGGCGVGAVGAIAEWHVEQLHGELWRFDDR